MTPDYKDIRTLDELSAAIAGNKARIESQGEAVHRRYESAQGFYTPGNLALQGVRRTALNMRFYANALALVRFLKKKIAK